MSDSKAQAREAQGSEAQGKESFRFELATPARAVAEGDYGFVIVPGAEGDFGVLAGHSALVSELRAGVIRARKARQVGTDGAESEERWFIAGGFAEVTPERLTLLVSAAEPLDSLDAAAIEQSIQDAQEDIADLDKEESTETGKAAGKETSADTKRVALERSVATNHARLKALETFGNSSPKAQAHS